MGTNASSSSEIKRLANVNEEDVELVPHKNEFIPCRIVDVYDGDTITVIFMINKKTPFKTKIRLLGIDAPELKGGSNLEHEAGTAVRDYLINFISQQRIWWLKSKSWDKYGGRMLAHIHVGNESEETLSSILLKEELVKEYYGAKKSAWKVSELKNICKKLDK